MFLKTSKDPVNYSLSPTAPSSIKSPFKWDIPPFGHRVLEVALEILFLPVQIFFMFLVWKWSLFYSDFFQHSLNAQFACCEEPADSNLPYSRDTDAFPHLCSAVPHWCEGGVTFLTSWVLQNKFPRASGCWSPTVMPQVLQLAWFPVINVPKEQLIREDAARRMEIRHLPWLSTETWM